MVAERSPGHRRPRQPRELPRKLPGHRVGQRGRLGQANGARQDVVLGLGQEVSRHMGGRRAPVGDQPLGQRHVQVARADDLVHPRNGHGPVGQGDHRLGTSDPVRRGGAPETGGRENGGAELPVRSRWRDHHQLQHAGDPGRNEVHEHGRRIDGGAPRDVAPHAVERGHPLAQQRAVLVVDPPGAGELVAVERLDSPGSLAQGTPKGAGHLRVGVRPLRLGDPQLGRAQAHAVEALRQLEDGRVPPLAHVVDEVGHPVPRLPGGGRGRTRERGNNAVDAKLGDTEPADHRVTPAPTSSRSRLTAR